LWVWIRGATDGRSKDQDPSSREAPRSKCSGEFVVLT
jgi:hypothetical protein